MTFRTPVSHPSQPGRLRRLAGGLTLLAGMAVAPLLAPVVAQAHAIVIQSNPKVNDTLGIGGNVLTVHFNSRIDRARSKLTIIGSDKSETPVTMSDSPDDETLSGSVTLSIVGSYKLRWQVLAVDGHTTRGDIPFTVIQP
ncbi:MAG: copper resistance protein CopC [Azospirillaceae bacterium]|nr:copper resistance protein CopC [Azospirillaceae bacterium]